MGQDSERNTLRNIPDKGYHGRRNLQITIHNPNSEEETAKYLAKEITKALLEQAGAPKTPGRRGRDESSSLLQGIDE